MKASTNGILNRVRYLLHRSDPTPDAELLVRFVADRDADAFALLVRRHGPMVHGVCRRVLRNQADADDVFQATFLVLARRAGAVRPQGLLGNWLYGIAYRTALEARRAAAVRRARERRAAEMNTRTPAVDSADHDLREALDRELAALPDVYRAAVVLCDLEGLSRKDAAERLGWREGTLSGRLFRARALLAARLERLGLAIPAAGLAGLTGFSAATAAVPAALAESTIKIGVLVAAGEAAAIAAAPVTALVEGVMKAMLLTKLKGLATCVVVGCAVLATATAGWRANAVGASVALVDGQARSQPPARSAQRDPDKDRIAELERERDKLLQVIRDLQTRLERLEADNVDRLKDGKQKLRAEEANRAAIEDKLKMRRAENSAKVADELARLKEQEERRARDARRAREVDGGPPPEVLEKLRKLEEELAKQGLSGDKAKAAADELKQKLKSLQLDADKLSKLKDLGAGDLAEKMKALQLDAEKLAKLKDLGAGDIQEKLRKVQLDAEKLAKLKALEAGDLAEKLKALDVEKLAKLRAQGAGDRATSKNAPDGDRVAALEDRVKALEADIKKLLVELERQRKIK
jgi:RNA polymerase sigma factor (sigma-70 family)